MNNTFRINIFYNEGTTKEGKKYKVPHTIDFGYNMTVQINNQNIHIQHDNQLNCDFIVYDAMRAGLKMNEKGYLTLHIG